MQQRRERAQDERIADTLKIIEHDHQLLLDCAEAFEKNHRDVLQRKVGSVMRPTRDVGAEIPDRAANGARQIGEKSDRLVVVLVE